MNDAPPTPPQGPRSTVCCRIEFYQLYGLRGWGSKFGMPCAAMAPSGEEARTLATVVVAECAQVTGFGAQDALPPGDPPST